MQKINNNNLTTTTPIQAFDEPLSTAQIGRRINSHENASRILVPETEIEEITKVTRDSWPTATKSDQIGRRINSHESSQILVPETEIEGITVATEIDEIAEASEASEAYKSSESNDSWSMVSEIETNESKFLNTTLDQALAILDPWVREKSDEHRLHFKFYVTDFIRDVEKESNELKELNASGLNLSALPEGLFALPFFKKELELLILDKNKLTRIPEEISQLDALRGLSLNDNPLNQRAAIYTLIQSKIDQNLDNTKFLENLENQTFNTSISIETWIKIETENLRRSIVHELATVLDPIEDKFIKAFVDELAAEGENVNPYMDEDFQEFIEEQYLGRLKHMIRIPGDEEIDHEESESMDCLEFYFLRNFFDSYRCDKIIEHFLRLINESEEINSENKNILMAWFEQNISKEEDQVRAFLSNQITKAGKFTKKAIEYLLYKCNIFVQFPFETYEATS